MKKLFLLSIILTNQMLANPSFTVGSNPYLTIFAYPHDLLKWPKSGIFFNYNPQTLPWQGDVTDINNRPSESYTNNYQNVDFAPPYDYQGSTQDIHSWMKVGAYAYQKNSTVGGLFTTNYGKFLCEFGKMSLDLDLSAEGVGRAQEEDSYILVPFRGETKAEKQDCHIKLVYANYLFKNPFGINFQYLWKNSGKPFGYISYTRNDTTFVYSRLTWGWATVGCNHIFGYQHINADAWFQDKYSILNGHQIDLQMSYEYKGNFKSGIRYRVNQEDGAEYRWRANDGPGEYINIDPNSKNRKTEEFLRAYSKIRLWQYRNLDAGFLIFVQFLTHNTGKVSTSGDVKIANKAENTEKEFIIETNPFFNYKFNGGYLDFGYLIELSRTSMLNTSTRWNNVLNFNEEGVLQNSDPYVGWTPSWENFSKGGQWFFATGLESYSSINIYKRLAFTLKLTLLKKYTFIKKYYGKSEIPSGEQAYHFEATHTRENKNNETWMTGSFGFVYGFGPVQMLCDLQLPLAYLARKQTVLGNNAKKLFEHEIRNVWQVQQPSSIRLLLVYAFGKMTYHRIK